MPSGRRRGSATITGMDTAGRIAARHRSWRPGSPPSWRGSAWQVVLTPTSDPDCFAVADGSTAPGGSVTFRRSAGGRVVSVFFMDFTWVRLDRVTA